MNQRIMSQKSFQFCLWNRTFINGGRAEANKGGSHYFWSNPKESPLPLSLENVWSSILVRKNSNSKFLADKKK